MTGPPAFVQVDGFSGVNPRLRRELENIFGHPFALVDVGDPTRLSSRAFLGAPWGNVLPMLRVAGREWLSSPRSAVGQRFATPYAYRHRSAMARERAAARDPAWVLQTQTMFDAALDGVPLFVFTDHTMLAQRRYPRPAMDVTRHREWIGLETATYRRAARVFVTSSFARTSLVEDYGLLPERAVDVGSGCNLPVPAAPPHREGPVREVLFVGLDWERKGGPILLEAVRAVQRRRPDVRLTVVGCCPDVAGPGVRVIGRVNAERVAELMREADVFAMPSWVEPSAGVYVEAGAYALPVLATDVGGTPERVLHGRTGWLSPVGDVEALRRNLERLVDDPAAAREQGRQGHELVVSRFTWPLVAQRVAAGIAEVVGS